MDIFGESVWGHHNINKLAAFDTCAVCLSETLSETKCRGITLFSTVTYLFFSLNLCHARGRVRVVLLSHIMEVLISWIELRSQLLLVRFPFRVVYLVDGAKLSQLRYI